MRIIKEREDVINTIIGEMLNLENATLLYMDGKALESPVEGYPVINDNVFTYTFQAAGGYIIVPEEYNTKSFVEFIVKIISKNDHSVESKLFNYAKASSSSNTCTNIRIKNCSKETEINTVVNKFYKRIITRDDSALYLTCVRFKWKIVSQMRNMCFNERTDIIDYRVNSIYYDKYDLLKFPHNTITHTLKLSDYRYYEFICQELFDEKIIYIHGATASILDYVEKNISSSNKKNIYLEAMEYFKVFEINKIDNNEKHNYLFLIGKKYIAVNNYKHLLTSQLIRQNKEFANRKIILYKLIG